MMGWIISILIVAAIVFVAFRIATNPIKMEFESNMTAANDPHGLFGVNHWKRSTKRPMHPCRSATK